MLINPTLEVRPSQTVEAIERALLDLQSLDYQTRRAAFASIKSVPKPYLLAAWQQVRQLAPTHGGQLDCFDRVEVVLDAPIECDRALATVITSGGEWVNLLAMLLHCLDHYGEVRAAKFVIFCVGECFDRVNAWLPFLPFIVPVRCIARENLSTAVKGVVYSCARWINAASIITLEADMLVIDSLEPLWTILENTYGQAMMGVRPQVTSYREKVSQVLGRLNEGDSHLDFLFGQEPDSGDTRFRWNGGLVAGRREAWVALDEKLREWAPFSMMWIEGGFPLWFAEEVLMNRATYSLGNPLELSPGWNAQVGDPEREKGVETRHTLDGMEYRVVKQGEVGERAKILHFLANGRLHMRDINDEIATYGLSS